MRQELLNKYKLTDFPEHIRHKIPRLLYLAATLAKWVIIECFLEQNFHTNQKYCMKLLSKIPISPACNITRKKAATIEANTMGQQFIPTICDDDFLLLCHEFPVLDEHFLTNYESMIDYAVSQESDEFLMELVRNDHFKHFVEILKLFNTEINSEQFVQVMALIDNEGESFKIVLQSYFYECKKLQLKMSLNSIASEQEKMDIKSPFTKEELKEMEDILATTGSNVSAIQCAMRFNVKAQGGWNQFADRKKRKWAQEEAKKKQKEKKQKVKQGKAEWDDVESSDDEQKQEQKENENKEEQNSQQMEPPASEVFSLILTNKMSMIIQDLQENIRVLTSKRDKLRELGICNEQVHPLGMYHYCAN